jgi:ABC-type transport system involved in cytochrome c biogenesis permease component
MSMHPDPTTPKGSYDLPRLIASAAKNLGIMSLALLVGTFVLLYITVGVAIIGTAFSQGVNPTLVLSIIGAPLWIVVTILCWKGAKALIRKWEQ